MTKIAAVTLALLVLLVLCSPTFGQGSCSTDKEVYSLEETVVITVEALSGGLHPVGELGICKVKEEGWTKVRSFIVPEGINFTLDWDQSGNTTDPVNGPFYQVEPGSYEILWYPAGVHGFFILCRFLICADSPDLNADGIVDIFDITLAASAYDSGVGEPRWISAADMAAKWGEIDIFDLATIASHYGETYP